MKEELTGKFVKGDRGPICRKPSDGGAWVIPDRTSSQPIVGQEYVMEIVGVSKTGRVRFARIEKSIAEMARKFREEWASVIFEEVKARRFQVGLRLGYVTTVTVSPRGVPFAFSLENHWTGGYLKEGHKWLSPIHVDVATREAMNAEAKGLQELERAEREERARIHREEQRGIAEQRNKEWTRWLQEQVAQDAPLVAVFFQEHPEAVGWFPEGIASLTWDQIGKEAVRHGLCRFEGEEKTGHYASFSKGFSEYTRTYSITVGGEKRLVHTSYSVGDYGDD